MTSYDDATDEKTPLTGDDEREKGSGRGHGEKRRGDRPRDSLSCSGTSWKPKWVVEVEGFGSSGDLGAGSGERDEDEDEECCRVADVNAALRGVGTVARDLVAVVRSMGVIDER